MYTALYCLKTAIQAIPPAEVTLATATLPISWGMSITVKNHILNIKKLNGKAAIAADVNKDGKISSMDYVLIKNHILGIKKITE